jgi:TPR repeat protein
MYEIAAERGNASVLVDLSNMFKTGKCDADGKVTVPVDEAKALELLQRAVDLGCAKAMYNMGVNYQLGQLGLSVDMPRAARLFRQAAHLGHAAAAYNYCIMLSDGRGGAKDDRLSFLYCEKGTPRLMS